MTIGNPLYSKGDAFFFVAIWLERSVCRDNIRIPANLRLGRLDRGVVLKHLLLCPLNLWTKRDVRGERVVQWRTYISRLPASSQSISQGQCFWVSGIAIRRSQFHSVRRVTPKSTLYIAVDSLGAVFLRECSRLLLPTV